MGAGLSGNGPKWKRVLVGAGLSGNGPKWEWAQVGMGPSGKWVQVGTARSGNGAKWERAQVGTGPSENGPAGRCSSHARCLHVVAASLSRRRRVLAIVRQRPRSSALVRAVFEGPTWMRSAARRMGPCIFRSVVFFPSVSPTALVIMPGAGLRRSDRMASASRRTRTCSPRTGSTSRRCSTAPLLACAPWHKHTRTLACAPGRARARQEDPILPDFGQRADEDARAQSHG